MKVILLAIIAAFGLFGCCSNKDHAAAPGEFETTEMESPQDPRGFWNSWRYGGNDPDRIASTLPLDPLFPPAPPR